jgi:uncharacterized protein
MSEQRRVDRRQFLKKTAIGIVGAGVAGTRGLLNANEKKEPEEPGVKEYRLLGRTGFKASDIASGGPSNLPVLNALLDSGVNYIDTAESYSNGNSEIITGQGIKNRDRKKLFITSKLHLKDNESKESILKRARKCLERLDTPYLDCMMMHNPLSAKSVKYKPFHDAMKQLKTEGKLRFTGISSHGPRNNEGDSMEKVLLTATQDPRFDVMLLVYNFITKDAGEKILAACKEKNIGATLMKTNPVGKYLDMKARIDAIEKEGQKPSERMLQRMNGLKDSAEKGDFFVKKYGLQNSKEVRTASSRYVLSNKNVTCVLCRCGSFEDVDHFLSISGTTISDQEIKKLMAYINGPGQLYCRHACGVCESHCQHNVPVNTIMRYNHYFDAQGLEKHAMQKYAALPTCKADQCINCSGNCEKACPFGVPVQGLLLMAHQQLSFA